MDAGPEASTIAVEVSDTQRHVAVDSLSLEALARFVLESEEVRAASISLALVDNAAIEAVNNRYLGHEGPTDVISFVLSEPGERVLAGELVISGEMAAAVAGAPGPARDELALYVVHGLLHLCGYDDQSPAGSARMQERQAELLAAWRLTCTGSAAEEAGPAGRERLRWSD